MTAFVIYGYVAVFNKMMKHRVDSWMDIPRIYT